MLQNRYLTGCKKFVRASLARGLLAVLAAVSALVVQAADQQGLASVQQANDDLNDLAKSLAELAATPAFRGFLRSEIAKSKNRENILSLDRFLERAAGQANMPPGLGKVRETAAQALRRLPATNRDGLKGYDLYIPVEAHRAKWKGGDDFVVAFAPLADDQSAETVVGYSVRDGKQVLLDAGKAPETVVLILAPEEHESHERQQMPPKASAEDHLLPVPNVKGKDIAEMAVEQENGNSFVGLRRVFIRDVKEPWWLGAPEIYAVMAQRKGTYCRAYTITYNSDSLEYLDNASTWRTTWDPQSSSQNGRCAGDGSGNSMAQRTCAYFDDANYFNRVMVYFYEADAFGNPGELVFDIYSGVSCSSGFRRSEDDYVDNGSVYRNNFNFGFDYSQDMGNAYVLWHKVH